MRELRTCPVTGRVVLLNDHWVDAPAAPVAAREAGVPEEPCWYCTYAGPVIARMGDITVAPHPVPALGIEGDPRPTVVAGATRRQGVGAHELVFGLHKGRGEGPLLAAVAARVTDLRGDQRLRGFGASRRAAPGAHAAWQLFAMPTDLETSLPAGWRDAERAHGERILEDGGATTLLAWAPRVPFEVWVLPAQGHARFDRSGPEVIAAVAAAVDRAFAQLSVAVRGAPIDLVLVESEPWRVELLPRLAGPTAVEVATGVPVHGVFPEAAAHYLRDARRVTR
ncbi:MAG: hypothetical protein Q8P18_07535 [Pseudomonadota bacterium]|nr:hypothetical protein [Pseudomonadota bacterium]